MNGYIDEMLSLTSDIVDRLLILKDTGESIDPELNLKIQQLAVISDRETTAALSSSAPVISTSNEIPIQENTPVEPTLAEEDSDAAEAVETEEAAAIEEEDDSMEVHAHDSALEALPEENHDDEALANASEFEEVEDADATSPAEPEITPPSAATSEAGLQEEISDTPQADEDEAPAMVIIVDDEDETPVEIVHADYEDVTPNPAQEEDFVEDSPTVESVQEESVQEATIAAEPVRQYVSPAQIRKAFSLNDIFFYRRTIFRGSNAAFEDALEYASRCNNTSAFAQYLRDTHRVDLKSDTAKDYIAIVSSFFC